MKCISNQGYRFNELSLWAVLITYTVAHANLSLHELHYTSIFIISINKNFIHVLYVDINFAVLMMHIYNNKYSMLKFQVFANLISQ